MAAPNVAHATYDEFKAAVIGRGFDLDGGFNYQCWSAVDLLYEQSDVGQYLYTSRYFIPTDPGYAKTCWTYLPARNLNASGHFTAVYNVTEIKRGDIIVFDTYPNWYGTAGHIAYADEDYNGTDYIDLLGQNQGPGSNPYTGTVFNVTRSYLGGAFLGIFRYDAWESTPPGPQPTEKAKEKRHFPWPIAWQHWTGFKRKF